jgi:hypothetical protein
MISLRAMTQTGGPVEVKGVETRWVQYKSDNTENDLWGISFTNMNSIPVSIESEVWVRDYTYEQAGTMRVVNEPEHIINTKSFVLKPNEEYLWKLNFTYYGQQGASNNERKSVYGGFIYYYVRFKAFKIL